MTIKTADIYDDFGDSVQVAEPIFNNYGGRRAFYGAITTAKVFEDNSLVRQALEGPGDGKVLVVDGGGSLRCALLGDMMAELGVTNRWSGIIIYGCIRDSDDIAKLDIGVKALATNPAKSVKRGEGQNDMSLRFAGVEFNPNTYVYADNDGILIAHKALISL